MSREVYASGDGYILYPLADVDRENYIELQLRLNGDDATFLATGINNTIWEDTVNDDNSRYFSIYKENGEYCGCIELQNYQSNTPEIGISLIESKRNQGIAAKVVKLLVQKVCQECNIDYFLLKIMSDNSHSKHVFEKMGAVPIGEVIPSMLLLNKLKETLSEDVFNLMNDIVESQTEDIFEKELIYEYKLPPETFL